MSLQLIVEAYRTLLTPFGALETATGARISPLDVAGALRLALIMRQLKDMGHSSARAQGKQTEQHSFVKDLAVLMVVVYGGEAFMAPWLGLPPSFLTSSTFPLLFAAAHGVVHLFPAVPSLSLELELPLALLDGMTRTLLLTELVPGAMLSSSHGSVKQSPFGLCLGSLLLANGGFFFVNLFSMLSPHGFSLATPAELQTFGWTTLDLWVAPITTAFFALYTQPASQPFWSQLHYYLSPYLSSLDETLRPKGVPNCEMIRAACAFGLSVAFSIRAMKNFYPEYSQRNKVQTKTRKAEGKRKQ
ncbi:hypothetical protein EXIGLDRAFT_755501 [Exidia glandulosa HHB12029]|uniref:Uncharacterized protein n=1 Tax=Exidia glandulosa HHB12029 TaxID=1314781 RepID=A0A165C0H3_EXIGL|nr:hypothetical protein EXIGLDRAFT_755501 [Exidia glandulosa HHB12029]